MKAKNHNITWLQSTNQTEIMPQYQSLDSRKRGKLRLAGGGPRQPHSEQWGGRFRRQLCVIVRYFEQGRILRADLDVAQLPANRRLLAVIRCEAGITLHRNAITAEPQRPDRAALWDLLVHRIFRRRNAVDDFLPHGSAQQTGLAENRQLLRKREFDDGVQLRQYDVADRAAGPQDENRF